MRETQVQQILETTMEFLGTLTTCLENFVAKVHRHDSKGEGINYLFFVNTILSRMKVSSLINIGKTHIFVTK